MKYKNFTFKKVPRENRSYELINRTNIKLNKKEVGYIIGSETNDNGYRIRFAVKREPTKKDPAPFKWIRLNKVCQTEKQARDFVRKYYETIQKKYNLYQFD